MLVFVNISLLFCTSTNNLGAEDEEDGDYTFKNSYNCLVDFLQKDLQIELNTPIKHIHYPTAPTASSATIAGRGAPIATSTDNNTSTHTANVSTNSTSTKCPHSCAKADAKCTSAATATTTGACKHESKCNKENAPSASTGCHTHCTSTSTTGVDVTVCVPEPNTCTGCARGTSSSSADAVVYDPNLIVVTTKDGVEYRAKTIVVTASPHVINTKLLTFSPPLPSEIVNAFDCTLMNNVTKVIMKFSKPAWPKDLHGMIMVDDDFLLPEVWFRTVTDEVDADEPATAYAVGFTTAKYAEKIAHMTQEEVVGGYNSVFTHSFFLQYIKLLICIFLFSFRL